MTEGCGPEEAGPDQAAPDQAAPDRIVIDVDPDVAGEVALPDLRALLARVLDSESVDELAGLTLRITGDAVLRELNLRYRGIDAATDVLAFPAEPEEWGPPGFEDPEGRHYLGDVAISVPALRRSSDLTGTPPRRELAHLATHGLLHLLGYDHGSPADEARMRARETELLGDWVGAIWDAGPTH